MRRKRELNFIPCITPSLRGDSRGRVQRMELQRMRLGEPDQTGSDDRCLSSGIPCGWR